jgi:molybdenum cofactor cytidylyltransferase
MTGHQAIAGLILAAGESSRMGADKALLTYRGRTFLETILTSCRDAGLEPLVVVLGHHAEEIRRAVKFGSAEVVINSDYQRGQTSSLQAGLRALESPDFEAPVEAKVEAIILCLVDHPNVSPPTVRKLIASFEPPKSSVVIPTFQGRRGHPVLIGRALFAELRNLSPDQGANGVIQKHRDATQFVEVSDPGVLTDVDDPEAYRLLT